MNAQRSSGKISCWCHCMKRPIKSLSVSAGLHICRDIMRAMTWHTMCLPIRNVEWQARLYVSVVSYVIRLTLSMNIAFLLASGMQQTHIFRSDECHLFRLKLTKDARWGERSWPRWLRCVCLQDALQSFEVLRHEWTLRDIKHNRNQKRITRF